MMVSGELKGTSSNMASFKAVSVTAKVAGRKGRESVEERITRMSMFFAQPSNQVFIPVGKLLAYPIDSEGTLAAQVIFDGGSVPVDALEVAGESVPVKAGYELSLSTIKTWGCAVCGSCEGSGVHPSPKKLVRLLLGSDWYYNPATQEVVTFSTTCFEVYVAGTHSARIVDGATWVKSQKGKGKKAA